MSRRRMMMATIGQAAMASVFFRATSTISQTTFVSTQPGSVPHLVIDEEVPDDDTSYVAVPASSSTFRVLMTGPPATGFSQVKLRFRISRRSGSGGRVRVYLENVLYGDQATTASWETFEVNIPIADTTSWTPSSGVEMKVIMSGFANNNQGYFTWAELEFK